jgi:hypothetical protein
VKSTMPVPDLANQLVWPGAQPTALVEFIGVSRTAGRRGADCARDHVYQADVRRSPRQVLCLVTILTASFHSHAVSLAPFRSTRRLGLCGVGSSGRLQRAHPARVMNRLQMTDMAAPGRDAREAIGPPSECEDRRYLGIQKPTPAARNRTADRSHADAPGHDRHEVRQSEPLAAASG